MSRRLRRLGTGFLAVACLGLIAYLGTLRSGLLAQIVPPTISTLKTGYLANEIVAILGEGFAVGEVVTLQVVHADGSSEAGDESHQSFTATAGETGTFSATWGLGENHPSGHAFLLGAAGPTSGQLQPVAFRRIAVVQTDKYDYQPGETAVITGAGFRPLENVIVQVVHSNGLNTGAGHAPFAIVAAADGRISTTWYVDPDDSEDSIFRLTATGSDTGLIATSTFTDSLVTVVDDLGPDDPTSGAQTDLNSLSIDDGNLPTALGITWNWDDTDFGNSGGNTGDACALVDTDQDGFANYAFCVRVDGNSAVRVGNSLYSCGDDLSGGTDRCTQPVNLISSFTSSSSASVVADSDPFRLLQAHQDGNDCDANAVATDPLGCNRADTVANVTLNLVDVGGPLVARLTNVCSYPSGNPNSNPSDCVFVPNSGLLRIVKAASTNDGTAFTFNSSASSQNGTSTWTINGSGTTGQVSFLPGTTYGLNEVIPTGWKLTSVSCAIQTLPSTPTGTPDATPAQGGTSAGVQNFEIRAGLETTCTFTDEKQQGSIQVVKTAVGGNGTFTFTPAGFGSGAFDLTTTGGTASQVFGSLSPGSGSTYGITETVQSGWDLTSSTCTIDGSPAGSPAAITVQDGKTTICTFENTAFEVGRAKIVVDKVTVPSGDPTSFHFSLKDDGAVEIDTFDLADGDTPGSSEFLLPGTYSLAETVPTTGWDLTNTVCNSSNGGTEDAAAIVLTGAETVTCTFTNTKQAPALTIVKTATPTTYSAVGNVISYSFLVTNSGNVTLSGPFTVNDDKATNESCPVTASLAPGASITCTASYTITQADLDAGSVTNVASVSNGTVTSPTDTETVTAVASPALTIVKTATPTTYSAVGNVISYSFLVTNSGNVTLSGPFTVNDDKATNESCPVTASLAPGASITCTASYTITQADLDAGSVTNVASVSNGTVTSPTDTETVTAVASPAIGITKSVALTTDADGSGAASPGDTLTYAFVVRNTGNVTLNPVAVADPLAGLSAITCPATTLAPGISMTCAATLMVTQAHLVAGVIANTATATGRPPTGANVTDMGSATISVPRGTVVIRKNALPAQGSFSFSTTGGVYTQGFTLSGATTNSANVNSQVLKPGNYTVTESTQLGWVLTGIGGSAAPNTPYACTVTGANGSSGSGNLGTQTATIVLRNGDTVTCVFENTATAGVVTRTQGFWATHTPLANIAWFGGTAFGHTFPGVAATLGDALICGRPVDDLGKLLGGFWGAIPRTSAGRRRSPLDQARMQLLQQLLAAELNASAFGSVPTGGPGAFAAWESALCGTDQNAIKTAQQQAASFNTAGDSGTFTPGTSADAKNARQIANIPFWDIIKP